MTYSRTWLLSQIALALRILRDDGFVTLDDRDILDLAQAVDHLQCIIERNLGI